MNKTSLLVQKKKKVEAKIRFSLASSNEISGTTYAISVDINMINPHIKVKFGNTD